MTQPNKKGRVRSSHSTKQHTSSCRIEPAAREKDIASVGNARTGDQCSDTPVFLNRLLLTVNEAEDLQILLGQAVHEIRQFAECGAVGIRLLDAHGNIPYEAYEGFSDAFYASESPLRVDTDQCMCISVIRGQCDPSLPFFTRAGSFFIDGTSRFMATVTEEEKGATRNACNGHGYESVALVPIRHNGTIIGLIHAADRKEGTLSHGKVVILETAGLILGAAIRRIRAEQKLQENHRLLAASEHRLSGILDTVRCGVREVDTAGTILYANPAHHRIFGYAGESMVGLNICDLSSTEQERQDIRNWLDKLVRDRPAPTPYEGVSLTKDGRRINILVHWDYRYDAQGDLCGFISAVTDISESKHAEFEIRRRSELLSSVRRAQSLFIAEAGQEIYVFEQMLNTLVSLTDSAYGFIDEIVREGNGHVYKKSLAMSNIAWDDDSLALYESLRQQNMEFQNLDNLAGAPVKTGTVVIANDAPLHMRAKGLPKGHPPITAFMGIPLYFGGEMVGVAGVANRPGGYDEDIAGFLEPFCTTCAAIIHALRGERHKKACRLALRERERELTTVLENAPVPIILLDENRRARCVNRAAVDFAGVTEDAIVDHSLGHALRCLNALHDERGCGHGPKCKTCRIRLAAMDTLNTHSEHRDVEVTLSSEAGVRQVLVSTAYMEMNGKVTILVSLADVTQQKQAEEALRVSEEKYRALYDNAPLSYQSFDENGVILDVNPAWLRTLGYEKEEVVGRSLAEFLHPDWKSFFADRFEALKRRGSGRDLQHCLRHKDGHFLDVSFDASVGYHPDGSFRQTYCVFQDITERKRAEEALRQSEANLSALIESTEDIIVARDCQGRAILFNKGFAQVVRRLWDIEAQPGIRTTDYLPELQKQQWEDVLKSVHLGASHRQNFTLTFNGQIRHYELFLNPIRVGDEIIGSAEFTRDVTERKRAEESLREAVLRQQEAVKAGDIGLWDWDLDSNKVSYSAEWKSMIGYEQHEINNDLEEWRSRVHPDDLAPTSEAVQQAIAEGRQHHRVEFRFRHSDGSYRWILAHASVLRDETGRALRMLGSHIDITDRKLSEQAVAESERRFKAIFNNSNDGILIIDLQTWKLVMCNPKIAVMLGYSQEELLRLSVADLHRPHDFPIAMRAFERHARGDYAIAESIPLMRKDGSLLYADISDNRISLDSKECLVTCFRDITERIRAEALARRYQNDLAHAWRVTTLGEMASGLAHEINQPLCAIVNYADSCRRLLASSSPEISTISIALEEIASQADRAGKIISRIRSLVQKQPQHRSLTDLHAVIRAVLELLEGEAKNLGIDVLLQQDKQDCRVCVDATLIHQVVLNLVWNAFEAMRGAHDGPKHLDIQCREGSGQTIEVTVSDTGEGIAGKDFDRVFDSFFTTKPDGLGIGLPLSRSIVKSHGGRLWLTRNAGRGVTFHFTLPLRRTADEH